MLQVFCTLCAFLRYYRVGEKSNKRYRKTHSSHLLRCPVQHMERWGNWISWPPPWLGNLVPGVKPRRMALVLGWVTVWYCLMQNYFNFRSQCSYPTNRNDFSFRETNSLNCKVNMSAFGSHHVYSVKLFKFIRLYGPFLFPNAGNMFLSVRREKLCGKLFNGIADEQHNLHSLLPPRNHSSHNLRRQRTFSLPGFKSERFKDIYSCNVQPLPI